LTHPHLLRVDRAHRDPHEGLFVIVMELAESDLGKLLDSYRKKGAQGIPPTVLLAHLGGVAEALDYLHANCKFHRDVKPRNIMLVEQVAKLGDFGLLRDASAAEYTCRMGTPNYMAPEAQSGDFVFASDLYSLAATYVQCRLGRPLFGGINKEAVMAAHCSDV